MRRKANPLSKVLHSATPALASVIAAAAYGLGAVAFSVASNAEPSALPDRSLNHSIGYEAPSLYDGLPREAAVLEADFETEIISPPAPVRRPVPVSLPVSQNTGPMIAIVIDDLGLDLAAGQRIAGLNAPLTAAILPYADGASDMAEIAHRAGHDVLVHLPMEPLGLADPGPHALQLALSDEDIAARTRWALARVPGAVGLNNHMGSRFTQDPRAMRVALTSVSEDVPLFLDSMTTGESRGAAVARGLGLVALERDIFLDHVIDSDTISARIEDAENLAQLRGWAIAIGHPHAQTIDALEAWISDAEDRGFQFVTLSTLAYHLQHDPAEQIEASILH